MVNRKPAQTLWTKHWKGGKSTANSYDNCQPDTALPVYGQA